MRPASPRRIRRYAFRRGGDLSAAAARAGRRAAAPGALRQRRLGGRTLAMEWNAARLGARLLGPGASGLLVHSARLGSPRKPVRLRARRMGARRTGGPLREPRSGSGGGRPAGVPRTGGPGEGCTSAAGRVGCARSDASDRLRTRKGRRGRAEARPACSTPRHRPSPGASRRRNRPRSLIASSLFLEGGGPLASWQRASCAWEFAP